MATTITRLLAVIRGARLFVGNNSGPGHIAAISGIPTVTIFGPVFPEEFHPLHNAAQWLEGAPCPHKPCFDRCRYSEPFCITHTTLEDVWARVAPLATVVP